MKRDDKESGKCIRKGSYLWKMAQRSAYACSRTGEIPGIKIAKLHDGDQKVIGNQLEQNNWKHLTTLHELQMPS